MSTKGKTPGRGLDEFRAEHDKSFAIPKRIRAALAELGDSWEYEADFLRRCNTAPGDFIRYRDEFAEFSVETPRRNGQSHAKRVWAGTKAFAAKLRAAVN